MNQFFGEIRVFINYELYIVLLKIIIKYNIKSKEWMKVSKLINLDYFIFLINL